MSNKTIIFLSGLAVGGIAGYLIGKLTASEKFNTELEKTRNYYRSMVKAPVDEVVVKEVESPEPVPIVSKTSIDFTKNSYKTIHKNTYNKLIKRVITEAEYDEGIDGYAKLMLTYYGEGDPEVLADDNDDIYNIESHIGSDSIKLFGDQNEDPDTIFIRNDNKKILYCVTWVGDSYENVTGCNPAEKEELI